MKNQQLPPRFVSKLLSSAGCFLIGLTPHYSFAEDARPRERSASQLAQLTEPSPSAPEAAGAPAPTAPATPQQETAAPPPQPASPAPVARFTPAQLEQMLAPIALYPDSLLAQVLPASAYPLDIVEAARWLESHPQAASRQDFSQADAQKWDPSVKALLRFPDVIKKLNADLGWTTSLGDAIVNQPQDVANAIQALRTKAMNVGSLKSTPQQKVTRERQQGREVVTIQSADPSVVYVPSYDPAVVYAEPAYGAAVAGLLTFGAAVALGSAWAGNYWNWGTGGIYRPVWPGYPGWRPPHPGWRPGDRIPPNHGPRPDHRPWRPDGDRYRPGGHPAGIGGGGRPGHPGAGLRPGGIDGIGRPGGAGGRPGADIGAPGRPGGAGGRPGAGIGTPGRPPHASHPVPRARPAARPAVPREFRGGRRPGGMHVGGMRARGFPGGGGMRAGGGFRGGGMRAGGFHGGGGRRGGRRSDLRLKHDVTLLGVMSNGLGFYRFVYNGGQKAFVGVIAQEVQAIMQDAVFRAKDGYLRVEYDKIGVKFQSYEQWQASGGRIPSFDSLN